MTLALSLFVLFYILMLAVQQYRPWVALGGAGTFLLLGKLGVYDFTLADAARAVDFNVLLMMAGMMGTVFLFIQSKMPARLAEELIAHVPDVRWAVSVLALLAGFISAFVDNVATVLMVAPVGLAIARRLRISPSQLEKYYTCRYGYFLQYVLGLRPRRRAELSADQSGSLMHWVLQMALDPHPGPDNPCAALQPYLELDDEAMAALAGLLVDEYAKRFLPEDTARFAYLLSRLKKSMTGLLCYLRDEQRQSSFRPVACELKIGSGGDGVRAQTYHLSDGRTVQLVGTVDRADEWVEEDGTRWVRVVDYKTGTKKLNLKEVYCGLDCQMLLYLFSLTRDKSGRFTGAEPAGVLYLLADPAPETTTREKAAHSVEYKLDGLVRDEQKLFDAMDADETGRYLPFSYYKGVPSPYQKDKRADIAKLNRIQLHLDDLVTRMGQQLYEGQIAAEPLVTGRSPCQWCDYGFVCCHETGIGERALEAPAKPFEAPGQPEEGEEEQA